MWHTFYIDNALGRLRAQGYTVREAGVARLSPFICKHINVHGRYSFHRSELADGHRPLRAPDASDDDEDE